MHGPRRERGEPPPAARFGDARGDGGSEVLEFYEGVARSQTPASKRERVLGVLDKKHASVRLDQIRVVSIEKQIHTVVGSLDAETMDAVDEALKLSLGLD